jgi:hypothetical protein
MTGQEEGVHSFGKTYLWKRQMWLWNSEKCKLNHEYLGNSLGSCGRRAPRDGKERAGREQDLEALELDPVLERATDDLWFQVEVLVAFVGHFVDNEDWRTSDRI